MELLRLVNLVVLVSLLIVIVIVIVVIIVIVMIQSACSDTVTLGWLEKLNIADWPSVVHGNVKSYFQSKQSERKIFGQTKHE